MNTQKSFTQAVVLFASLALAGIGIAVGAQFVLGDFAQTVMVAIGSAIFGAGLTFFLIRMSELFDK
jgi:hypothetical protein